MERFEPTFHIVETSRNIRNYIRCHMAEFWALVRYVAPFLLVLMVVRSLADLYVLNMPHEQREILGGSVFILRHSLIFFPWL